MYPPDVYEHPSTFQNLLGDTSRITKRPFPADWQKCWFKFLSSSYSSGVVGFPWPLPLDGNPGELLEITPSETVVPCASGIHAVRWQYIDNWTHKHLFVIELTGETKYHEHKVAARGGRLLYEVEDWNAAAMRLFVIRELSRYAKRTGLTDVTDLLRDLWKAVEIEDAEAGSKVVEVLKNRLWQNFQDCHLLKDTAGFLVDQVDGDVTDALYCRAESVSAAASAYHAHYPHDHDLLNRRLATFFLQQQRRKART